MDSTLTKATLLILIVAMTLLDGALTLMYVSVHGTAAELNPFMRWVMETYGNHAVITAKLIALGFLLAVFKWITGRVLAVVCIVHVCLMIYWSYVL